MYSSHAEICQTLCSKGCQGNKTSSSWCQRYLIKMIKGVYFLESSSNKATGSWPVASFLLVGDMVGYLNVFFFSSSST